jgi:hypothetical protein
MMVRRLGNRFKTSFVEGGPSRGNSGGPFALGPASGRRPPHNATAHRPDASGSLPSTGEPLPGRHLEQRQLVVGHEVTLERLIAAEDARLGRRCRDH